MRILILTTFPIDKPKHGGQLRVRNLFEKYRSLGYEVLCVGVLGHSSYPLADNFIPYPEDLVNKYEMPYMDDYVLGDICINNSDIYEKLKQKISFVPDLIHVEHPWLFKFAEKFSQEVNKKAKLIYGSENIEFKLKNSILSKHFSVDYVEKCVTLTKEVELYAVSHADVCLGVSEKNCEWLASHSKSKVFLGHNGVEDRTITKKGEQKFDLLGLPKKYAIFCGSGHPPNCEGLWEMLEPNFGSLSPDQKLVIVGGVSHLIKNDIRFANIGNFKERTTILGEVDGDLLTSLLKHAHCILLPITQGEGTNLKTAEALWNCSYVVATNMAFRGFEKYRSDEGVLITDSKKVFKQFIRIVMSKPKLTISEKRREGRRSVLWSEVLKTVPDFLNYLKREI